VIQVRDVRVRRGGRDVLHEVSLDVERGAWCALIGPNGAGKTTLLRALASGRVDAGTVEIGGVPVRGMGRRRRAQRIAVVEQQPVAPAGMVLAHYVSLGRTPYVSYFGGEGAADRRVAAECLERLELTHLATRLVTTLSGGEWQRAVVARALAQQPELLLLDEPTSALDVGRQLHVMELIDGLRADDLTVVSATHDLGLAAAFADHVVLLGEGVVVAEGAAAEVLREDLLSQHYRGSLRVLTDGDGHMAVVPSRGPR